MKHEQPPQEAIRIEDRWYVLATAPGTGDPPRVLKDGESFALFDRFGDMPRASAGEHGLYHQGTRFLARCELRLNGQRPMLLNSSVRRDNSVLSVECTNPDVFDGGELAILKGTVHLSRSWLLWDGAAYQRVEIANYGEHRVVLRLSLEFESDFVDIFEVRGFTRERRGEVLEPAVEGEGVALSYAGLDGVVRRTRLAFSGTQARRVRAGVGPRRA
jgi:glycogen debranching enzyme